MQLMIIEASVTGLSSSGAADDFYKISAALEAATRSEDAVTRTDLPK